MNIYFHRRVDDSKALYIDGYLQFDSLDEAIYHESLVLPALCLAKDPRSVLICGGGDALALREALRYPGVEQVTLIDCSPEVLNLARTELSNLNRHALDDPRVSVVIADALEYPLVNQYFDVIICDFTFPTTKESALGFTVEWYAKLKRALKHGGMLAVNAVSPQNTASAFACLVSTVRTAGFCALPYRVCIPSFRDHGFGAWGFILASEAKLSIHQLENLSAPVETRQVDLKLLARGAHFSVRQRAAFRTAPANHSNSPVLQKLLLDPTPDESSFNPDSPPAYPNLLHELEVSHPYHSRTMIETLSEQVAGSLKSIDLHKLISELAKRAKDLPQRIVDELEMLRSYLSRTVLDLEIWGKWAARLFATILIVMTIANSISPDPAFAKGHAGLGHSSFSRGFASHESFGGGTTTTIPNAPISGRGFRSSYGSGPVDIYGYHYTPRVYIYGDYGGYGGYYGGGYYGGGSNGGNTPRGGHQPLANSQPHKPLFVLDDDLLAMENGDFVVPLSDLAFLVVSGGNLNLVETKTGKPLYSLFPEPKLFTEIQQEVATQGQDLDREVTVRKDWLSWAGWTSEMFGTIRADNSEYLNLKDLQRRLGSAASHLGRSPASKSLDLPEGAVELFVGCHILSDNRIALYGTNGRADTSDGKSITTWDGQKKLMSPGLKTAIVSILKKMIQESQQDIASDLKDAQAMSADISSTQMDLNEYQSIQTQNSYDPTYEVDYGTDSIPVGQAVQLTQQDLSSLQLEQQQLQLGAQKAQSNLLRFQAVLQAWSE